MKKRTAFFVLVILFSVFIVTSIKAAGSAPSVYNSDAKSLLEMLWAKLDEAIVSNYNAGMLVRYHDHEGTNPGDFTSRGLPIGTNGIENGAITAAKMSTAAKTKIVTAQVGDMAAGGTTGPVDEKPIFVAPTNGTITAVTFTTSNNVSANGTNYTSIAVWRWRGGSYGVGYIAARETNTSGLSDFVPIRITGLSSEASFVANDVYSVYKYDFGSGTALNDLLVTLEYIVSG